MSGVMKNDDASSHAQFLISHGEGKRAAKRYLKNGGPVPINPYTRGKHEMGWSQGWIEVMKKNDSSAECKEVARVEFSVNNVLLQHFTRGEFYLVVQKWVKRSEGEQDSVRRAICNIFESCTKTQAFKDLFMRAFGLEKYQDAKEVMRLWQASKGDVQK